MNEWVRRQHAANHHKEHLCCIRGSRNIHLTVAFVPESSAPVWIAKSSSDPEAIESFQREAEALEYLRPWSSQLNVPLLLDAGCEEDGNAWIIQTGLKGNPQGIVVNPASDTMPAGLSSAIQWLDRFQKLVKPPPVSSAAAGPQHSLFQLADLPLEAARLAEHLRFAPPEDRVVASHGDYWSGNILYSNHGTSVIDWEAFAARSPVQDLFTCFAACQFSPNSSLEIFGLSEFKMLFFSNQALSSRLRGLVAGLGVSGEHLRFQLHSFIGHRLASIDPNYREGLVEVAGWLSENNFPGPWELTAS